VVGFFIYGFYRDGPTRLVQRGAQIRQDDFQYSVVGVNRTRVIGRTAARGVFYVVTVAVENDALRVDYVWDPSIVRVVDAQGTTYRALDFMHGASTRIPAGATRRFEVAFDLPQRVRDPALAFSNGILMGDVFDGASYAKARIPLN
jgi:hypothetical protein